MRHLNAKSLKFYFHNDLVISNIQILIDKSNLSIHIANI